MQPCIPVTVQHGFTGLGRQGFRASGVEGCKDQYNDLKALPVSNWLLVDGFRLGFRKKFLKTWIVTDWIPDGIDP